MMIALFDEEGCGRVAKTRAGPSGTAGTARCAGSMARADVAGESGDERKSSIFD
jgi:hypothetical protein